MKFPLEWFREFVEITMPPAALADRLTAAGMVVDTIDGDGESVVFEIDVPTNRPDCMNVYGLAREIAALSGRNLCPYPSGAGEAAGKPRAQESVSIEIEAKDLCGRYCGRVVRKITPGPSPDWMVRRLLSVGLNPVNNIVDVTNYVLWELGHPLHAFDLALLRGRRVIVRRARRGEPIQTLDGVARHLDPDMLVIADAERAIAVAGVMGGANTMISSGAAEVLLESAWFDPVTVRRTSKRLGLPTDASYRFERGADIEAASVAIDRAAALLAQVAGGEVAPGLIDVRVEGAMDSRTIHLRLHRVETLLGMNVNAARAEKALETLGFAVRRSGDGFEVGVPHHRQDVTCEADLIEEVARSIGYEAIPESLPVLPGIGAIHRFAHRKEDALRASIIGSGYTEVITYSFVSSVEDWLLREEGAAGVTLTNPMAEGQEILRSSMFPGLVDAVRHNLNHGVRDVRLFEVGRVFRGVEGRSGRDDRKHQPAPGTEEALMAGLAATGLARPRHWLEPSRDAGFYDVKGAIEEALSRFRVEASFTALKGSHPFRPGACACIVHGARRVGRIGVLSADAATKLGIKTEVALAEIDLSDLLASPEEAATLRPVPRFPAVTRDLALVVRRGVLWADLERAIRESGGDLVARATVFDRYSGGALPPEHVSLAVSVVYQAGDRTLATEEVASVEAKILAALRDRFSITLRQS